MNTTKRTLSYPLYPCSSILDNTFIGGHPHKVSYGVDEYKLLLPPPSHKRHSILILDWEGYVEVSLAYPERVVGLFLDTPYDVALERASSRPDFEIREFERRFKTDSTYLNAELVRKFAEYEQIYILHGERTVDELVADVKDIEEAVKNF